MKKHKLVTWLFFATLFLLPNCGDAKKDESKNESYEFISFKKVEFGSLDESSILYYEPEEVDCLVTIVWERTNNRLHVYDESYGIIDYKVIKSIEENNEFILEAKEVIPYEPSESSTDEENEENEKALASLEDHIDMQFNKNDSIAILQINNAFSGRVYYMNLQ